MTDLGVRWKVIHELMQQYFGANGAAAWTEYHPQIVHLRRRGGSGRNGDPSHGHSTFDMGGDRRRQAGVMEGGGAALRSLLVRAPHKLGHWAFRTVFLSFGLSPPIWCRMGSQHLTGPVFGGSSPFGNVTEATPMNVECSVASRPCPKTPTQTPGPLKAYRATRQHQRRP